MNVTITSPFWKRRRDQIVESVIPYQWGVMNDEIDTTVPDDPAGNQLADNKSHAVANLKVAAGELDDEFHGMSSRIPTSTSGLRKPPTRWPTTRIPSSRRCATARSISLPALSSRMVTWTPLTRSSPAYGPTARASA